MTRVADINDAEATVSKADAFARTSPNPLAVGATMGNQRTHDFESLAEKWYLIPGKTYTPNYSTHLNAASEITGNGGWSFVGDT